MDEIYYICGNPLEIKFQVIISQPFDTWDSISEYKVADNYFYSNEISKLQSHHPKFKRPIDQNGQKDGKAKEKET